jgi:cell division protein FtsB
MCAIDGGATIADVRLFRAREVRQARAIISFGVAMVLLALMTPTSLRAQEQSAPSPTTDQLRTQISILQDQIKALSQVNDQYRKRAELADDKVFEAYVDLKKREFTYYARLMDVNIDTFRVQKFASYVVLFLVCIVVTSGVLFSGFQLWKSVSVAGVQASNDLEISAAKVRVTSSVVGIVVLTISLAFLFIYTREVYTIRSLQPIQSNSASSSSAN